MRLEETIVIEMLVYATNVYVNLRSHAYRVLQNTGTHVKLKAAYFSEQKNKRNLYKTVMATNN